ncbi:unnamed protein product [Blepharisma stoltei]|uniref:Uncharacterized protein n=1 Tax=Blepharisma stoltei TaxID=1481888 RepID=A0AAU9IKP4_9CILI|nr:unnamed protein product [Blepharisma stoltei]
MKIYSILNSVGKAFSLFIGLRNQKIRRVKRALNVVKCDVLIPVKKDPIQEKRSSLGLGVQNPYPAIKIFGRAEEGFKAVFSAPILGCQEKKIGVTFYRFLHRVCIRPILDAIESIESENLSDYSDEGLWDINTTHSSFVASSDESEKALSVC